MTLIPVGGGGVEFRETGSTSGSFTTSFTASDSLILGVENATARIAGSKTVTGSELAVVGSGETVEYKSSTSDGRLFVVQ